MPPYIADAAQFRRRRPPWYRLLSGYHWFVLLVASLGWMFDCLDQQLFILARMPAMKELLAGTGRDPTQWSTIATSVFMVGWASGGLAFGVLGDRIGRARTMLLTILLYSLCTGLSAFSVTFWDFAAYRFHDRPRSRRRVCRRRGAGGGSDARPRSAVCLGIAASAVGRGKCLRGVDRHRTV